MARFTALIEWQVKASWFELDSRTRLDYTRQLQDILARFPGVRFRWFDAEAWTGKFTDFSLCEFEDLDGYNSLWGALRRHPFLATPYASVSRVLIGMELVRSPVTTDPPPAPADAASDGLRSCGHCGHLLKVSAKFCGGCGRSTQKKADSEPDS
ncbi:hypothetical protein JST97_19955 [bacterium]|nr:hypothetical protein [bacterium]